MRSLHSLSSSYRFVRLQYSLCSYRVVIKFFQSSGLRYRRVVEFFEFVVSLRMSVVLVLVVSSLRLDVAVSSCIVCGQLRESGCPSAGS